MGWRVGMLAVLAALHCSGCNLFAGDDVSCASGADCWVSEDARYCTAETALSACGVFDACTENICVPKDALIAVINNPLSGTTVAASQVQHAAIATAIADVLPRFSEFEGRGIEVVQLAAGNDLESMRAAFDVAKQRGASVILTLDTQTAVEAQKYFSTDSVLLVGLFTNVGAFANDETESLRTSFGLIPEPRADIAMWAKFLRETARCESVAAVYVSSGGTAEDLRLIDFIDQYAPQHRINYLGEVGLKSGGDFTSAVQELSILNPDCVFAFPITNESPTNTFAGFLSAWSSAQPTSTINWLFSNQNRLSDLAIRLDDASRTMLHGGIAVQYAVGGEAGDDLLREFRASYQLYMAPCFQGQCPSPLSDEEVVANGAYVSLAYDQGVLSALAIYLALRESTPSRASIRDGFRSINGGAVFSLPCSSSDPSACFDAIDQGARPNYRGASGELRMMADGRPETLDEKMVFREITDFVGAEPVYIDLLRVDHTQMADALRNPSPD